MVLLVLAAMVAAAIELHRCARESVCLRELVCVVLLLLSCVWWVRGRGRECVENPEGQWLVELLLRDRQRDKAGRRL